jgi:hypothetical protein
MSQMCFLHSYPPPPWQSDSHCEQYSDFGLIFSFCVLIFWFFCIFFFFIIFLINLKPFLGIDLCFFGFFFSLNLELLGFVLDIYFLSFE